MAWIRRTHPAQIACFIAIILVALVSGQAQDVDDKRLSESDYFDESSQVLPLLPLDNIFNATFVPEYIQQFYFSNWALALHREYSSTSWAPRGPLTAKPPTPIPILAFQSFWFQSFTEVAIFVWDCFCVGDSFQILDNGMPQVPAFAKNPASASNECNIYLDDKLACVDSDDFFGAVVFISEPGFHNITILVNSPYQYGSGFIMGFYNQSS